MIVLILAAGYATRLHPLTLNTAKPLLRVGNKLILEHIFDKISELKGVKHCFIVTNDKFFKSFKNWAEGFASGVPISVVNDETTSNENRLGAIRDIEFVIRKKNIKEDLLVIGGDNLFEFRLEAFAEFARAHAPCAALALFDIKDTGKAKIYGVAKIDQYSKVVDFSEKPSHPKSSLIATCVYYFPKEKLGLIERYVSSTDGHDAPGNYIKWLSENDGVFGFVFKQGWYDIGDIASYNKAHEKYLKSN